MKELGLGGSPQFYLPDPFAAKGTTKGCFFVDYTRQQDGKTEFYEIKPVSYMKNQRGDRQLQKYVDRANNESEQKTEVVKGTSILSKIEGQQIPTWMFCQGAYDPSNPGMITLYTDPENHPGMIFYSLDDGQPEPRNVFEEVADTLNEILGPVPIGTTEPIFDIEPVVEPIGIPEPAMIPLPAQ